MKRIIVTRFSAMGDVAMVASVLKEFQQQHTDTEIIIVTRKLFFAFFEHIPRILFHELEPNGKHHGIWGLYRLFNELKTYQAQFVADLHNNIRSKIVDAFFLLKGCHIQILDKGRHEKKALIQHQLFRQLKPTTERYADVFRQLGFPFTLSHQLPAKTRSVPKALQPVFEQSNKKIGVAPFAQHPYKVWSLVKVEEVLHYLSQKGYQVFIFGGGQNEHDIVERWSENYPDVHNTIGKFTVSIELDIIANLDLMISMDSSGMHMASLVGTRCLSIWGATHPFAGFLGFGQSYGDCIQVEHPNRPSSIYGNKPCDCDGIEAIELVSSEMVINHIKQVCE